MLTVARIYCPYAGSSTLIASFAMLFKFVNAPFWGCHLLGIFLIGAAFDLLVLATGFDLLKGPKRMIKSALLGAASAYLSFGLFAVMITYVFRYPHWAHEGIPRVLDHLFVGGTMAAVGSAIGVPLIVKVVEILQGKQFMLMAAPSRMRTSGIALFMMILWICAGTVSV